MIYHFLMLNSIISFLSHYYGNYLKKIKHVITAYNDISLFQRHNAK